MLPLCLVALALLPPIPGQAAEMKRLSRPGGDRLAISEEFDLNQNGVLEKQERIEARLAVHDRRKEAVAQELMGKDQDGDGKISKEEMNSGRRRRGASFEAMDTNSDGFITPNEARESVYNARSRSDDLNRSATAERIEPGGEAEHGASLYDENVLRTFHLQFEDDEWLDEMHDFYRTDVAVPANLIVGGKVYEQVGVKYRGNSSFRSLPPELKRSLDLSINHGNKQQRLLGYKTINLLNAHDDPTFLREVLYSRIGRDYIPAFKANWVRLAINGESWGIYANVQQYNNDFLKEWFGSRDGVRWKGRGSLTYEGTDLSYYRQRYIVKTDDAPREAWDALIEFCRLLKDTPDDKLEETLKPIFDIDGALWSIALENIFVDEGYLTRGSDYNLFRDGNGRFHLLQHDGNEVFNRPGGPGIPRSMDATKLPLYHEANNEGRPVVHRLLGLPHIRARYTAHVRTIIDDWLSWERLAPIVANYRALISEEVRKDVRKESSFDDFFRGDVETVRGGRVLGLKQFVEKRRNYLLSQAELQVTPPSIASVSVANGSSAPLAGQAASIDVTVGEGPVPSKVLLHWALDPHAPFTALALEATAERDFRGSIPAQPLNTQVYYYFEARSEGPDLVSSFLPRRAESAPYTFVVSTASPSEGSPIVINEILANNKKIVTDPQGDFEDYIELHNTSDQAIDLGGMYLSDSPTNPRKYRLPNSTWIAPHGFLLIWADEDGKDSPGLHANFRIAASGERIQLIDCDERGNSLLDQVDVPKHDSVRAYSRHRSSPNQMSFAQPTPGTRNE